MSLRLDYLAKQIQDAAKEKGINGVTDLQVKMKKDCGLSGERVRKVWYGEVDTKIRDYMSVTSFLECDLDLLKGVK